LLAKTLKIFRVFGKNCERLSVLLAKTTKDFQLIRRKRGKNISLVFKQKDACPKLFISQLINVTLFPLTSWIKQICFVFLAGQRGFDGYASLD